jgi:hypothetical protein
VAAAPAPVCVVADMGTADPTLAQRVAAELESAPEAWSLWSATDGELVTYDEYYDVLKSDLGAGSLKYEQLHFGTVAAQKAGPLSAEAFTGFQAKIAGADQLCDLDVPSFGGATYHYLHAAKTADGGIKTFGAFIARNPEYAAAGAGQAAVAQGFAALAATLAN